MLISTKRFLDSERIISVTPYPWIWIDTSQCSYLPPPEKSQFQLTDLTDFEILQIIFVCICNSTKIYLKSIHPRWNVLQYGVSKYLPHNINGSEVTQTSEVTPSNQYDLYNNADYTLNSSHHLPNHGRWRESIFSLSSLQILEQITGNLVPTGLNFSFASSQLYRLVC